MPKSVLAPAFDAPSSAYFVNQPGTAPSSSSIRTDFPQLPIMPRAMWETELRNRRNQQSRTAGQQKLANPHHERLIQKWPQLNRMTLFAQDKLVEMLVTHGDNVPQRFPSVFLFNGNQLERLKLLLQREASEPEKKDNAVPDHRLWDESLCLALQAGAALREKRTRVLMAKFAETSISNQDFARFTTWPARAMYLLLNELSVGSNLLAPYLDTISALGKEATVPFLKLWKTAREHHVDSPELLFALINWRPPALEALQPVMARDPALVCEKIMQAPLSTGQGIQLIDMLAQYDNAAITEDLLEQVSAMMPENAAALISLAQQVPELVLRQYASLSKMTFDRVHIYAEIAGVDKLGLQKNFAFLDMKCTDIKLRQLLDFLHRDPAFLRHPDLPDFLKRRIDNCHFTRTIDNYSGQLLSNLNPYIAQQLQLKKLPLSSQILRDKGVTRAILEPQNEPLQTALTLISSENHKKNLEMTIGRESERFFDGLDHVQLDSATNQYLNVLFGSTDQVIKRDSTLVKLGEMQSGIEINSAVLSDSEDGAHIQSTDAVQQDRGAHFNYSGSDHFHVGIGQYHTSILIGQTERAALPHLDAWDMPEGAKGPRSGPLDLLHKQPTPVELLFMKQLMMNMLEIQDKLPCLRMSSFSKRHSLVDEQDEWMQLIAEAPTLRELIDVTQLRDSSYFNVNLGAYRKGDRKTLEFRGFGKAVSANMEVDPVISLRDFVLVQTFVMLAKQDVIKILRSGVHPDDEYQMRPHSLIHQVAKDYAETIWACTVLHALKQREPGKMIKTMSALMNHRELDFSDIVKRIRTNLSKWIGDNRGANHFLNALEGKEVWQPDIFRARGYKPLRTASSSRTLFEKYSKGE